MYRELCAVAYALEICDIIIVGSKHPITVFADHKPIISLSALQGPINQKLFSYQLIFTKLSNLVIFWTRDKNLVELNSLVEAFPVK